VVQQFKIENEVLFHPETVRRTIVFLETLLPKAIVPFVPRSRFTETADQLKKVKTPPGFKDLGDGDFFVWSDLLFGLLNLQRQGVPFERIILVTNDGKIDWCREGAAHPILAAEANALLGVGFEIWTLDKSVRAIG